MMAEVPGGAAVHRLYRNRTMPKAKNGNCLSNNVQKAGTLLVVQGRAAGPGKPGTRSSHAKELFQDRLAESVKRPPIQPPQYPWAFLRHLLRPAYLALGRRR